MNWDSLNAFWDQQDHWDRPTLPNNLKELAMNAVYKLVLNFLRWGEARFGTKAEQIITAMTTEPMLTLVPNPLPATVSTRAAALTALANYKASALVAADGSKTAIKDRDQKRLIVEDILRKWAPVLELAAAAANDITILEQSQYDLRQPAVNPSTNGVPPAPVIFVTRGKVSGSVLVRVKPVLPRVDTYEAQYAIGDSVAEANFTGRQIAKTGSRIEFVDLELAKTHRFRVRGIGSKGPGDWSDAVSIIVT
jgi:hypothetical protein